MDTTTKPASAKKGHMTIEQMARLFEVTPYIVKRWLEKNEMELPVKTVTMVKVPLHHEMSGEKIVFNRSEMKNIYRNWKLSSR